MIYHISINPGRGFRCGAPLPLREKNTADRRPCPNSSIAASPPPEDQRKPGLCRANQPPIILPAPWATTHPPTLQPSPRS